MGWIIGVCFLVVVVAVVILGVRWALDRAMKLMGGHSMNDL
jgi:hypothetical protein